MFACIAGEYLGNTTCVAIPRPPAAATMPACLNRSRASECLQRGNWAAATVIVGSRGPWVACAPVFISGLVVISACTDTDVACCATPTAWWTINCTTAVLEPYCRILAQQNPIMLTSFDQWEDGIPHNILVGTNDPPHLVTLAFTGSSIVSCLQSGPVGTGAVFVFTLADITGPRFGSVYRIWSNNYEQCILDRPLGADEQVFFNG